MNKYVEICKVLERFYGYRETMVLREITPVEWVTLCHDAHFSGVFEDSFLIIEGQYGQIEIHEFSDCVNDIFQSKKMTRDRIRLRLGLEDGLDAPTR